MAKSQSERVKSKTKKLIKCKDIKTFPKQVKSGSKLSKECFQLAYLLSIYSLVLFLGKQSWNYICNKIENLDLDFQ